MAMTSPVESVSFTCPAISPKHYIVKGQSGWPETFERRALDAELERFLAPVKPRDLAEIFVESRELAEKQEPVTWHTVIGFLGRSMQISPLAVPATVGIAFWAAIVLFKRDRERGAN